MGLVAREGLNMYGTWCFLGFDSWGCRAQGGGQAWVLPIFILHESTVKATFNTPYELLGGYQEKKPRGVVQKMGVLTPWGADNSLVRNVNEKVV